MTARIVSAEAARALREDARQAGRIVVFTNGCFDLLHRGHVDLLTAASRLGDMLIVGLNSDASVARLKGPGRPYVPTEDRAAILVALRAVDLVVVFEEDTPLDLIRRLLPDVLVKGADYRAEDVVGAQEVRRAGGRVELLPLTAGRSSSGLAGRITAPGPSPPETQKPGN